MSGLFIEIREDRIAVEGWACGREQSASMCIETSTVANLLVQPIIILRNQHQKRRRSMPIYEFICQKCDHAFSLVITISEYEKKNFTCPKCKSDKVKRQISSFQAITSKKS
jgi:putative FmdB family regulatory protein